MALTTRGGRAEVAFTFRSYFNSPAVGVRILYTLCYGTALYEETLWLTDPGPVWRHGHPFADAGGPIRPETIQAFVNYRTDFEIWANESNAVPTRELSQILVTLWFAVLP